MELTVMESKKHINLTNINLFDINLPEKEQSIHLALAKEMDNFIPDTNTQLWEVFFSPFMIKDFNPPKLTLDFSPEGAIKTLIEMDVIVIGTQSFRKDFCDKDKRLFSILLKYYTNDGFDTQEINFDDLKELMFFILMDKNNGIESFMTKKFSKIISLNSIFVVEELVKGNVVLKEGKNAG